MERHCLECGEAFKGRVDKKFCSAYCRNMHNNRLNKDSRSLIRNTNNALRKNYRILKKLNPKDKSKTTRKQLTAKGFNFNLITSIYTTKKGTVYYFIYDQGYLPLEKNYFALVKKNT